MAERFDAAVVGCGPVGALAACLLAQRGLRTVVVERAPAVYDLPRAVHFDAQIMRLFQQVGIADELALLTREWRRSVFTGADGELLRVHEFPTEHVEGWAPHLLFYQPELEHLLRDAATRLGAELRLSSEVESITVGDEGASLAVRRGGTLSNIETRWLIGCDGASSTVRKQLGIELDDLRFDEPWLVVDAIVDDPRSLPRESRMVCDPRRPATLIEGRGTHRRWEFMLLPGERPEDLVGERHVRQLIAEWIEPDKVDIVRAAVYRFHGLVANRWRHRSALLAGDAAHQTPPFLGQGMCHGMRDVSNLAWKLAALDAGHAGPGLLDSYEEERKPHVAEIIAMSVAAGRDICILDPQRAAERDRRVRAQAAGAALPPSPFLGMPPLPGGWLGDGPGAGALFPQPRVVVDGRDVRLDDLCGRDWSIVVSAGEQVRTGAGGPRTAAELAVPVVTVSGQAASGVAHDPTRVVERWMNSHGCRAALVRPDRYVFATADSPDALAGELAAAGLTSAALPAKVAGWPR